MHEDRTFHSIDLPIAIYWLLQSGAGFPLSAATLEKGKQRQGADVVETQMRGLCQGNGLKA